MFLYNNRYIISLVVVLVFWNQLKHALGTSKLPFLVSDIAMPVVLVLLLAEVLAYLDKALDVNNRGNLGPEFMTDFDPEGSGKFNDSSQRIANAEYYRQINEQLTAEMNPVTDENDEDSKYTIEPDDAAPVGDVEEMSGGGDSGGGDSGDAGGMITQADADAAAQQINVPMLGSVVPSNAVANDTSDYNNSVGCMVGKGDCPLLCSKPKPENPCNLVAPVPGGPWQVQSASMRYNGMANGNYVPAKCDIEKMELIRRGDIPQSAQ